MLNLCILARSDAFASYWPALAAELEVELRVVGTLDELQAADCHLPPLLVIGADTAGAEDEVRDVCAWGPRPIVVGVDPDHRLAVGLVRAGAGNYFALPGDAELLRSTLAELIEARTSRDQHHPSRGPRTEYDFSQIVGNSPAIRATLQRASRVIPHAPTSILITGETGTGKELLARAIHFNGPRARAAFVEINCAAIPGGLLESELFGFERGAFTDARNAKPGLFEAASGGTLFLDEIGHLPLDLQGKLLKAIEEKEIRRLGSVRPKGVDLRIIAATNSDLLAAVQAHQFRDDLYYRLTIIPLQLPPLRERGTDVILLAEHFLRRLGEHYRIPVPPLTDSLKGVLLSHPWPGNVRELRNALERALLLGDGELEPSDLFLQQPGPPVGADMLPFPAPMETIEIEAARRMVRLFDGNKSAAAEALAISRSRLYRLLEGKADEVGGTEDSF